MAWEYELLKYPPTKYVTDRRSNGLNLYKRGVATYLCDAAYERRDIWLGLSRS